MNKKLAKQIASKLSCRDTYYDNCFSENDYFVGVRKKGRSFQIQSDNRILFKLIEVGLGPNKIKFRTIFNGTFFDIDEYIQKEIK